MANVFSDIELVWGGKTYTIKSHRVMGAMARMEEHITLTEMGAFARRGTAPLVRMCQAYAAVLQYAGARITPEEVYQTALSEANGQMAVFLTMMQLMMAATPPGQRAEFERRVNDAISGAEAGETDGDTPPVHDAGADPGNSPAAAAAS
jgi:hypothetical protein